LALMLLGGPMRVIVCGGRHFGDEPLLFSALDELHAHEPISCVVHGGASGADTLAGQWAVLRSVLVEVHPAKWTTHGRAAGPIRNREMLAAGADLVVAFPGGRGTADMMRAARQYGVAVWEL
jgi:hypothetical protein